MKKSSNERCSEVEKNMMILNNNFNEKIKDFKKNIKEQNK